MIFAVLAALAAASGTPLFESGRTLFACAAIALGLVAIARSSIPPLTCAIIKHGGYAPGAGLDPALKADPTPGRRWACAPLAFTTVCEAQGKAYNREQ